MADNKRRGLFSRTSKVEEKSERESYIPYINVLSEHANTLEAEEKKQKLKEGQTDFISYRTDEADLGAKSEESTDRSFGKAFRASKLDRIKTKEQISDMRRRFSTPSELREISAELYQVDANYAKMISYHKNMFHVRYLVLPFDPDKKVEIEGNIEEYNKIMNLVDGLTLETTVPSMLEDIFILGITNVYFDFDEENDIITSVFLPVEFCRTSFQTSFGTNAIEFNFKYFEKFNDEDREVVLDLFPDEFRDLYNESQTSKIDWLLLDPTKAGSIEANESGVPPFVGALDGILEHDRVRKNELEKSDNELNKIMVNEVPLNKEGYPIFEVDELRHITQTTRKIVARHKGLDIITAFGKTDLHALQEEGRTENRRIGQAYKTVYSSAGINPTIFAGEIKESIEASRNADKAYVWSFIREIQLLLNVIFNNYHDGNLQAEIQFLPVAIFEEHEVVQSYREQATFGIGKLDAVVASGVKQSKIHERASLEKLLDLDNILLPLSSAHTRSKEDTKEEKQEEEVAKEPEVIVDNDED